MDMYTETSDTKLTWAEKEEATSKLCSPAGLAQDKHPIRHVLCITLEVLQNSRDITHP